jgi:hypothetical protein
MMFENAIAPYLGKYPITIGVLDENEKKYSIQDYVRSKYGDAVTIVVLPAQTTGPADTVYQILQNSHIDKQSAILIRDCDSFFDHEISSGNYVCVSSIVDHDYLTCIAAKSYVVSNVHGIISNIVEKQVVSDKFCVGGYKFESAGIFLDSYQRIAKELPGEIFISHVIQGCLNYHDQVFKTVTVSNYVDVGTAEDWVEYNDKAVIFCDIDGTIVKAQHRKDFGQPPEPLERNICRVQELAANGGKIVFTTARPDSTRDLIHDMLEKLGFTDFKLITGLPNVKRILINDYNLANPYPRAIAVNVRRDADDLPDLI